MELLVVEVCVPVVVRLEVKVVSVEVLDVVVRVLLELVVLVVVYKVRVHVVDVEVVRDTCFALPVPQANITAAALN